MERRIHDARRDGVHADAVSCVFHREMPGDRFKTAFSDHRHGRRHPPDRVARYQMPTFEIQPEALLIKIGFPIPRPGSNLVTQDDFPGVIAAIERAADAELGAGLPAARPSERSRYRG